MDLNKTFPRSPQDRIQGLVHIPRMIDKAKASKNHTLGEYIYPCPLDKIILNFIRTSPEEFSEYVTTHNEDQVDEWVKTKCSHRSEKDKHFINQQILGRSPDGEERWDYFYEVRNKIDPSRTDISTWVDLIDLEEGRLPPKSN